MRLGCGSRAGGRGRGAGVGGVWKAMGIGECVVSGGRRASIDRSRLFLAVADCLLLADRAVASDSPMTLRVVRYLLGWFAAKNGLPEYYRLLVQSLCAC